AYGSGLTRNASGSGAATGQTLSARTILQTFCRHRKSGQVWQTPDHLAIIPYDGSSHPYHPPPWLSYLRPIRPSPAARAAVPLWVRLRSPTNAQGLPCHRLSLWPSERKLGISLPLRSVSLEVSMTRLPTQEFAAFVGIDWADATHAICWQV